MGRLIALAEAAIPESMPEASANPDPLRPLSPPGEPVSGALPFAASALWWRIAITEPGGARTVEVDTPSGYIPSPTGKPTPTATTALDAP